MDDKFSGIAAGRGLAHGTLFVRAIGSQQSENPEKVRSTPPVSTSAASAQPTSPNSGRARRSRGVQPQRGRRDVKEYPLTERELNALTAFNVVATLCFSLAGFLLALVLDIQRDLMMTADVPTGAKTFWSDIRIAAAVASGLFTAGGVAAFWFGRSEITRIKEETTF